jgi:hypothetical protein
MLTALRQIEPNSANQLGHSSLQNGALPPEIQRFKSAYVLERRILERMRYGADTTYTPSATLDGVAKHTSAERPAPTNRWVAAYDRVRRTQPLVPWQYVRLLFSMLRTAALPVPQINQLTSASYAEALSCYLVEIDMALKTQFLAESQRARDRIVFLQRGSGYSFATAVYYAVVDNDLGLTPLFRYSLSQTAADSLTRHSARQETAIVAKLEQAAQRHEFLAALDYALFPDLYDAIWGQAIPDRLRVVAPAVLSLALAG